MKILITGANGMLAKDLIQILENQRYLVVGKTHQDLDITNKDSVIKVLKQENPDIVIQCAAYTKVDDAENNLNLARKINAKGCEIVAKACNEIDSTMIYISTDYVFDGEKFSPYTTSDTPKPLNNYGLTKYEGELAVKNNCQKYYIVRTSWLYGNFGKNFVDTMLNLGTKYLNGEISELKVVDDQIGCPTWTKDLSEGIAKIIKNEPSYGVYHICGGGKASWCEFAKEIFKIKGMNVKVTPCTTEEFLRPAKRPHYSVMTPSFIIRPWQEGLAEYLQDGGQLS